MSDTGDDEDGDDDSCYCWCDHCCTCHCEMMSEVPCCSVFGCKKRSKRDKRIHELAVSALPVTLRDQVRQVTTHDAQDHKTLSTRVDFAQYYAVRFHFANGDTSEMQEVIAVAHPSVGQTQCAQFVSHASHDLELPKIQLAEQVAAAQAAEQGEQPAVSAAVVGGMTVAAGLGIIPFFMKMSNSKAGKGLKKEGQKFLKDSCGNTPSIEDIDVDTWPSGYSSSASARAVRDDGDQLTGLRPR